MCRPQRGYAYGSHHSGLRQHGGTAPPHPCVLALLRDAAVMATLRIRQQVLTASRLSAIGGRENGGGHALAECRPEDIPQHDW